MYGVSFFKCILYTSVLYFFTKVLRYLMKRIKPTVTGSNWFSIKLLMGGQNHLTIQLSIHF